MKISALNWGRPLHLIIKYFSIVKCYTFTDGQMGKRKGVPAKKKYPLGGQINDAEPIFDQPIAMIPCIIVDDKPLAIDLLKAYCSDDNNLRLIGCFDNPVPALEFIATNHVDLVFLDVQMPVMTGIRFMELLQGKAKVILVTAYSKYALEGYEHDVIDYLLKPVAPARFTRAVEKAAKWLEQTKTGADALFLKTGKRIQRVAHSEILYVESKKNYVSIVCAGSRHLTLDSLTSMEQKLSPLNFVRVHRSYIVNLEKIQDIQLRLVKIDGTSIPLGQSYRSDFLKRLNR